MFALTTITTWPNTRNSRDSWIKYSRGFPMTLTAFRPITALDWVACGVAPRWPARTLCWSLIESTIGAPIICMELLCSPCNWETLREGRSERRDCVISRFQELLFLLKWSSLRTWLLLWGQTSSRRMSTCGPDVLEQNPQVDIYLWFVNCIWQYSMTRSILRVSILFF